MTLQTVRGVLLLLALLCFILAAFGVSSKIGLEPAGLALCVLAYLVG